jgi:DNA mismatch repair ATPase MutS
MVITTTLVLVSRIYESLDVVLFFKKGKFYELYDCDADIGHSFLGLNYTAGGRVEMRCVGVPETSFARYASKLVDNGFKVALDTHPCLIVNSNFRLVE